MDKIKFLNLYAGIGGNRRLLENIDVVSVEINSELCEQLEKNFPADKIIQADAHEFLLNNFENFDFIWSSPPCQSHSKMAKFTRHKLKQFPDLKLYEEIIFLNNFFKGKFVVENVIPYYEPLIKPDKILNRHCFWSNFYITNTYSKRLKNFIDYMKIEEIQEYYGIKIEKNIYLAKNQHDPIKIYRNAVDPQIGKHVFDCAFQTEDYKQENLF